MNVNMIQTMTELCSVIYHYYASFWLGLEMRPWKSPMGFRLQSFFSDPFAIGWGIQK